MPVHGKSYAKTGMRFLSQPNHFFPGMISLHPDSEMEMSFVRRKNRIPAGFTILLAGSTNQGLAIPRLVE